MSDFPGLVLGYELKKAPTDQLPVRIVKPLVECLVDKCQGTIGQGPTDGIRQVVHNRTIQMFALSQGLPLFTGFPDSAGDSRRDLSGALPTVSCACSPVWCSTGGTALASPAFVKKRTDSSTTASLGSSESGLCSRRSHRSHWGTLELLSKKCPILVKGRWAFQPANRQRLLATALRGSAKPHRKPATRYHPHETMTSSIRLSRNRRP